jgi:hypothetical protein
MMVRPGYPPNVAYEEKARVTKSGGQREFNANRTPPVAKPIHAKDMSPEESRPKSWWLSRDNAEGDRALTPCASSWSATSRVGVVARHAAYSTYHNLLNRQQASCVDRCLGLSIPQISRLLSLLTDSRSQLNLHQLLCYVQKLAWFRSVSNPSMQQILASLFWFVVYMN